MSGSRFRVAEIIQQSEDGLGFSIKTQLTDEEKVVPTGPHVSLAERLQQARVAVEDDDETKKSLMMSSIQQEELTYLEQQEQEKKKTYAKMYQEEQEIRNQFLQKQRQQLSDTTIEPSNDDQPADFTNILVPSTKISKFSSAIKRALPSDPTPSANTTTTSTTVTHHNDPSAELDGSSAHFQPKRQKAGECSSDETIASVDITSTNSSSPSVIEHQPLQEKQTPPPPPQPSLSSAAAIENEKPTATTSTTTNQTSPSISASGSNLFACYDESSDSD